MPEEVVGQELRATVDLPAAEDLEGVVVEEKNAAGAAALGAAQGGDIAGVGTAVNGVKPGVAGPAGDLASRNDLHQARPTGIGLGVDDSAALLAQPGPDQGAPLQMGMSRGTEGRTAGVPAAVVEFVADRRQVDAADDRAVGASGSTSTTVRKSGRPTPT